MLLVLVGSDGFVPQSIVPTVSAVRGRFLHFLFLANSVTLGSRIDDDLGVSID